MLVEIIIRKATLREYDSVRSLYLRASLSNAATRDELMAHPEVLVFSSDAIAQERLFAAESGNCLVGFASVAVSESGNAELEDLFVEPDVWRRGVGRALVTFCTDHARLRGAKMISVVAAEETKRLYERCGFSVIGTDQTALGPALKLRALC